MSPIKGISDRRPRLIRVGKLHLGVKAKSTKGTEYPKQVDYFVCKEDASTSAEAAAAFRDVYGDKPKELDIVFPADDELLFADQNFKMYSRSWQLTCRGDGEEAMAKWDVSQDGAHPEGVEGGTWAGAATTSWVYRKIPCLAAKCPMQASEKPSCKGIMNLQFMLPLVVGIGVWQIDTGSWNSMRNVLDGIETVRAITGGRVRGVPLTLGIVPKEVTPANQAGGVVAEGSSGSIKTKTVQVLQVGLPGQRLPDMLRETRKLEKETALMALPAPVDEEEVPEDQFPEAAAVDTETGEVLEGEARFDSKGHIVEVSIMPEGPPKTNEGEARAVEGQERPDAWEAHVAESQQQPPAAPEPPSPVEPPILTLGELLNRCLKEFKVDKAGVLKILGVADEKGILNFAEAYRVVKRVAADA